MRDKADQLFRDLVRSRGYCQLAGLDGRECEGRLETMHIEPRGNYRLRWEPMNALCGCAIGHHAFYTNHDALWWELIAAHFPEQHQFILTHINEPWDRDYTRVLAALQEELREGSHPMAQTGRREVTAPSPQSKDERASLGDPQ